MLEFETTIEIAGKDCPALVTYEVDLDDGWPLINTVEAGRIEKSHYDSQGNFLKQPRYQFISVDITPILDEETLKNLEEDIVEHARVAAGEARIEQAELA